MESGLDAVSARSLSERLLIALVGGFVALLVSLMISVNSVATVLSRLSDPASLGPHLAVAIATLKAGTYVALVLMFQVLAKNRTLRWATALIYTAWTIGVLSISLVSTDSDSVAPTWLPPIPSGQFVGGAIAYVGLVVLVFAFVKLGDEWSGISSRRFGLDKYLPG